MPAPRLFLFTVGVILGIPVVFVGNILAGEILLGMFAVAGFAANIGDFDFLDRRLIRFVSLFALALSVYVLTDLIFETAARDAARGSARFAFLLADALGIWAIGWRYRYNVFPVMIGYLAGQALAWARPESSFRLYVSLWKHHLCLPVLLGLLCASSLSLKRGSAWISVVALVGFGVFSFQVDTRAFGMICLLAAAVVAARLVVFARIRALMPFFLAVAVAVSAYGVSVLLNQTRDRFGQRQLGSNELRYAAIMTAVQTIAEHPWTGIGSWKTDFDAANRHRANLVDAGGQHDSEQWNQSGHSQVLQTWLEGGPLASAAFIYLFWRMALSLLWLLRRPADGFLPFAVMILLNGLWSCLFSPFLGADIRVNVALAIYVCVLLAKEKASVETRKRARAFA